MRLTFAQVQSYARENGFWIEKRGNRYFFKTDDHSEGEANTLAEAWSELYGAIHDRNVLAAGVEGEDSPKLG